jgi:hypothetical protein
LTELMFTTYARFAAEHARYAAAGRVAEVRTTDRHWIIVLSVAKGGK